MQVREPIVDGIFYPDSPEELLNTIASNVRPPTNGNAKLIISPHAAFAYTAQLMTETLCEATNRDISDVIILGPCLREHSDFIYLTESDVFKTPLGESAVNTAFVNELHQSGTKIEKNDIPHLEEHVVEVQLPILQFMYPAAKITPILLGSSNFDIAEMLARALATVLHGKEDSCLIVAAMNLSDTVNKKRCNNEIETIDKLFNIQKTADIKKTAHDLSTKGLVCAYTALRYLELSGISAISKHLKSFAVDIDEKAVGYGGFIFT